MTLFYATKHHFSKYTWTELHVKGHSVQKVSKNENKSSLILDTDTIMKTPPPQAFLIKKCLSTWFTTVRMPQYEITLKISSRNGCLLW